jgi:hypothetical protein
MATESSTIVQRLWNYCNVLRYDGMSYGDYIEQRTCRNTPIEKTQLQRQTDATDSQIDTLVYELYGLTEKEIKVVEGDRSMG